MGGAGAYAAGSSTAVDGAGNVYTIGSFSGTADFDPGPDTFNLTSVGGRDIFIVKLDTGGHFIWAKQFGGLSNDYGNSITVDVTGKIYVAGYFQAGG